MRNRNIFGVLGLILFLALFFQYNRMDGFTRLLANTNASVAAFTPSAAVDLPGQSSGETFLLIYNPIDVRSVFVRRMAEEVLWTQKKRVVSVADWDAVDWQTPYDGVLVATGDLARMVELPQVLTYMREGGRAAFLLHFTPQVRLRVAEEALGIRSAADAFVSSAGVAMKTSLLFGAKGFSLTAKEYATEVLPVSLTEQATVHATTQDGVPLVWEIPVGKGRAVVYNGERIGEKTNRGLLAAMLARTKATYVYPIINAKAFFIDDFPSPEPEGYYEKIYAEFGLTTSQFYRDVWWPDMLAFAERYGIKYTGLIIESYNNQVKPPFAPEAGRKAKDNLIIYGRELLKMGGELGIHGYNHQSLVPPGYAPEALGYEPWESKEDMVASLRELKRYIGEVYPQYEIRVYVPPSNVLSPSGKEAIKEAFPDLKIFSSLYSGSLEERAYYQSFGRNADGTFELPRVVSGFVLPDDMKWEAINVLNAQGIFTHFIHPDELFYEESEGLTWKRMREGYGEMLAALEKRYGWLRSCTASQAVQHLDDYLHVTYRLREEGNALRISCQHAATGATFVLRSERPIEKTVNCQLQEIDAQTYLLRVAGAEAEILFGEGEAP